MRHFQSIASGSLAQSAATLVERLRERAPRVHSLTNTVAQNFTANVLLAAGCIPSMTWSPDEVGSFVAGSDALLINLGTLDAERRRATEIAVDVASARGIPWVLDPAFVTRSPARADFARALIARKPTTVRLNHAEFECLAGVAPSGDAASAFARTHGCVVALSGKADLVSDGTDILRIENGHRFMSQVTAMGCAGSALLAACLAVGDQAFAASAAALLILGIAGESAAEQAAGPGSFAVGILDALSTLAPPTLIARARIA